MRAAMIAVAEVMIAGLRCADFETLVDLIFARSGWQRISRLGGSQKGFDLIVRSPESRELTLSSCKSGRGPIRWCLTIA
jgi:hypothetical protein